MLSLVDLQAETSAEERKLGVNERGYRGFRYEKWDISVGWTRKNDGLVIFSKQTQLFREIGITSRKKPVINCVYLYVGI